MLTVIKLAPTIIFAFFLLLSIVGGLLRGFRKSLILFIHWVIAVGIGFALFFVFKSKAYTSDISIVLSQIPSINGADISGAKTFAEAMEILANQFVSTYGRLIEIEEIRIVVISLATIAVNLALFIVCLIVIPFLIRFILRIFYILFYSESKHKRAVEESGDIYSKHRLFGMLVGLVRGLIVATLAVSLFSSVIFIAAGTETDKEKAKEENTATLTLIESFAGQSLNVSLPAGMGNTVELLNALAESRSSGIGALLDKIAFDFNKTGNKTPIDYLLFDMIFSTAKFNTNLEDEEGNVIQKKVVLREELASLKTVLGKLANTGVIKVNNGKITVMKDKLESAEVDVLLNDYIANSNLMSGLIPLAIVGFAKGINKGYVVDIPENIQAYFTDENIAKIEQIDFSKDLQSLIKVGIKGLELLDSNSEGALDLTVFSSGLQNIVKFALTRDQAGMKELFNDLADIELATSVLAPIAYGYGTKYAGDYTEGQNMARANIALENVNWKYEVSNFGNIFATLSDFANLEDANGNLYLDLILDLLSSSATPSASNAAYYLAEEESSSSNKVYDFIKDIAKNENAKTILNQLIDTLFSVDYSYDENNVYTGGSYLLGNTTAKLINYGMLNMNLSSLVSEQIWNVIRSNYVDDEGNAIYEYYTEEKVYTEYSAELLNKDLHDIIESSLDAIPLALEILQMDRSDTSSLIKSLVKLDLTGAEEALIGEKNTEGKYIGGLYDIRILAHREYEDVDGVVTKLNSNSSILGEIIETLLKDLGYSLVDDAKIDEVEDWKYELGALINAVRVIQGIEGIDNFDYNNISSINKVAGLQDDNQLDKFTKALSDSVILSNLIKNILVQQIDNLAEAEGSLSFPPYKDSDGNEYTWAEATENGFIIWTDEFELDSNGNYKLADNGEKIVKELGEINHILKAACVFTSKIEDGATLSNMISISTLKSITDEEINKVVDSKVIINVLPTFINQTLSDESSENNYCEDIDTKEEWANELKSLVKILNIEGLISEDNKINLDIDTFASLKDDEIITIAKSQILMQLIPAKLESVTGESLAISIPSALKKDADDPATKYNWKKWQYQNTEGEPDYTTGEFYKVMNALRKAKEALNQPEATTIAAHLASLLGEDEEVKLTTDNLMEAIFKMDHNVLFASDVLYLSTSNIVLDQESILHRADAVTNTPEGIITSADLTKHGVIIKKAELVLVLDTLYKLGITSTDSVNDLNAETILNKLDDVREDVCVSNILNITCVDKIISNVGEDALSIPVALKNKDNDAWYVVNNSWEDGELAKLLLAIKELKHSNVEGGASIGLNGNEVTVGQISKILSNLEEASLSDPDNKSKLDVAYLSDIFALTLSKKIEDQKTNGIEVRSIAYDEERKTSTEDYLNVAEIKLLVGFINGNNLNIESISADTILGLIAYDNPNATANIAKINKSNILNITFVSKATGAESSGLKVPAKYRLGGDININDPDWYYDNYANESDAEVYKMLDAVSVAGISNIDNVDTSNIIKSIDTDLKVEIAYASDIFAYTISYNILNDENLLVPETYKTYSGSEEIITTKEFGESTYNYIALNEIKHLVKAVNTLEIDFTNTVNVDFANFMEKLKEDDSKVEAVISSTIITLVMAKQMSNRDNLEIPEYSYYTDGTLVQYKTQTKPYFIYQEEVKNVILAANHSNLDLSTSTLSMDDLNVETIETLAGMSNIFRATISKNITKNISAPTKDYDGNSIYDDAIYTGVLENYLTKEEITATFKALDILGLNYGANATALNSITLNDLLSAKSGDTKDRIDYLLESTIMLKELSKNLIEQNVVSYNYPKDNSNNNEVSKLVDTFKFVKAQEIKNALIAAKALGVNDVEHVSSEINENTIKNLNAEQIGLVENSSIICLIISKIIVENVSLQYVVDYYNFEHASEPITPTTVTNINNDLVMTAYTQADLVKLLTYFASYNW